MIDGAQENENSRFESQPRNPTLRCKKSIFAPSGTDRSAGGILGASPKRAGAEQKAKRPDRAL